MNSSFQLPRGVCALREASGAVFTPTAGYTATAVTDRKWMRVYRVVCSVDQVSTLVTSLVDACLPEKFYAILAGHWFGDRVDTYLSAFLPRARIQAAFAPHLPILLHDGMVEHGFACCDATRHEEIFLDDHKELTVLTSIPGAVEEVLERHGLPRNDALEFLSQHGHGHSNLGGPEANYCRQIIQELEMQKVSADE